MHAAPVTPRTGRALGSNGGGGGGRSGSRGSGRGGGGPAAGHPHLAAQRLPLRHRPQRLPQEPAAEPGALCRRRLGGPEPHRHRPDGPAARAVAPVSAGEAPRGGIGNILSWEGPAGIESNPCPAQAPQDPTWVSPRCQNPTRPSLGAQNPTLGSSGSLRLVPIPWGAWAVSPNPLGGGGTFPKIHPQISQIQPCPGCCPCSPGVGAAAPQG